MVILPLTKLNSFAIITLYNQEREIMNKSKIKMFFIGLLHLIISPIYIPVMVLWEARDDIKDYYSQCFNAVTFRGTK